MTVHIVRLGQPRAQDEGTRLGTVRRPPRGVPRKDFARLDWYDVWFPVLAPSAATLKLGLGAKTEKQWKTFARKYRAGGRVLHAFAFERRATTGDGQVFAASKIRSM